MANEKPVDALATLGQIIDDTHGRDAIHLAVVPVQAAHDTFAGEDIGLDSDRRASTEARPLIGIVDPFLKVGVRKGAWFWMVLYPRTITSLRHVWSHPAFADEPLAEETPDVEPRRAIALGASFSTLPIRETPAPIDRGRAASEAWLRDFVSRSDCPSYEEVMGFAVRHINDSGGWYDGERLHISDSDASGSIPPEFWDHVEVVTGRRVEPSRRATYFSCSC